MFVGMLLAVLSQFTQIAAGPRDAGEMVRLRKLEARRAELDGVVQRLLQAQRQQNTLVATLQEDPDGVLAAALQSLLESNADLAEQRSKLARSAGKAKARLDASVSELTKLRGEIDELREKTRAARRTAKAARVKNTRELRLPKLRDSFKGTYWIAVRWNRLYILKKDNPSVRHKKVAMGNLFEPIPERGVDLKGQWMTSDDVLAIRNDVSPARSALHFAVWPDSYATFIQVRDYFVDLGYDYNWAIQGKAATSIILVAALDSKVQ